MSDQTPPKEIRQLTTEVTQNLYGLTLDQYNILKTSPAFLGLTPSQLQWSLAFCKQMNINPFLNEVSFQIRKARRGDNWVETLVPVLHIGTMRIRAHRSGDFGGIDAPTFTYKADGTPDSCTIAVYRKSIERPFVATCWWDEVVQLHDGKPNASWEKMKRTMLAKCTEAAAHRKAFPDQMESIYISEEMQDDALALPKAVITQDPDPLDPAIEKAVLALGWSPMKGRLEYERAGCDKEAFLASLQELFEQRAKEPARKTHHDDAPVVQPALIEADAQ